MSDGFEIFDVPENEEKTDEKVEKENKNIREILKNALLAGILIVGCINMFFNIKHYIDYSKEIDAQQIIIDDIGLGSVNKDNYIVDFPAVTSMSQASETTENYTYIITSPNSADSSLINQKVTSHVTVNQSSTVSHSTTVTQSATVAQTVATAEQTMTTASVSNGKININTASLDELMTLDGIGEKKAQAIIDYRYENGNFHSVYDLTNVSGIGEKTLEKNLDKITV